MKYKTSKTLVEKLINGKMIAVRKAKYNLLSCKTQLAISERFFDLECNSVRYTDLFGFVLIRAYKDHALMFQGIAKAY